MKYNNIIKHENKLKLKDDLCELYVTCECLEEFIIKANLTYGKIPWRLLTAFKLFYIKKSKPLLYYSVKFSFYLLLGYFIYIIPNVMSIFLFPISEFIFACMFYDNMKTIEWYDDGCPKEY
jgi:hypothetical protein